MRHESIDGVVVRVRDYGDHDRYLSVLTADAGRITMLSKGGHSLKGPQTALSQLYTYANFEYYRKGEFNILKGGSAYQHFYALSMDIDRLNLAAYLCDLACELTDEGEPAPEMLRMLLNALYAISKDLYPQEIIKGAFELRAMAMSGYAPDLGSCSVCGCDVGEHFYLHIMNGSLLCSECFSQKGKEVKKFTDTSYDDIRGSETVVGLTPAVCAAMRYVISAPLERLFAFGLEEANDVDDFARATQTYVLSHLERGFDSLNFYHTMRNPVTHKETKV